MGDDLADRFPFMFAGVVLFGVARCRGASVHHFFPRCFSLHDGVSSSSLAHNCVLESFEERVPRRVSVVRFHKHGLDKSYRSDSLLPARHQWEQWIPPCHGLLQRGCGCGRLVVIAQALEKSPRVCVSIKNSINNHVVVTTPSHHTFRTLCHK